MFRWEIEIITGSGAGLLRQHGLAKYPPVLRILKFVLNGLWGTFPRLRHTVLLTRNTVKFSSILELSKNGKKHRTLLGKTNFLIGTDFSITRISVSGFLELDDINFR